MGRSKHASPPKRKKAYRAPQGLEDKIAQFERNRNAPGRLLQSNLKAHIAAGTSRNQQLREQLAQPMDEDQCQKVHIGGRAGLRALIEGQGGRSEWEHVAASLNLAGILSERGIGYEYQGEIQRALDAVFALWLRARDTGNWSLDVERDAENVRALELGLDIHDEQVKIATQAEIGSAIGEVERRQRTNTDVYKEAA